MNRLEMTHCDPRLLQPAPWNPNEMDAINFQKLINSIKETGFHGAVKVRKLDDGTLEIVGGEHRTRAAIELGYSEIPIINLGNISQKTAKKIMLVDNERYGESNSEKLADIFRSDLNDLEEILSILPYDEEQIDGFFAHDVDMDNLDFDNLEGDSEDIDLGTSIAPAKTHQIIRFKVPIEDAARISETITRIKHTEGYDGEDELTNAGDALVHFFNQHDGSADD